MKIALGSLGLPKALTGLADRRPGLVLPPGYSVLTGKTDGGATLNLIGKNPDGSTTTLIGKTTP